MKLESVKRDAAEGKRWAVVELEKANKAVDQTCKVWVQQRSLETVAQVAITFHLFPSFMAKVFRPKFGMAPQIKSSALFAQFTSMWSRA